MTPSEEKLLEQLRIVNAALMAFGEAVRGVGRHVRRFCREYDYRIRLATASTQRERRRLVRDWQRFNRRPALIHNGGRPRV